MRKIIGFILLIAIVAGCSEEKVELSDLVETITSNTETVETAEIEEVEENEETVAEYKYTEILYEKELNKRDLPLLKTEKGEISLYGEGIDPSKSELTVVLEYKGEFKELTKKLNPAFKIITDDSESYYYTDATYKRIRIGENGEVYLEYAFQGVTAEKAVRMEVKLLGAETQAPVIEPIIFEDSTEKLVLQPIYQYESELKEPIEIKDKEKTIKINHLSYTSEYGLTIRGEVSSDVDKGLYIYLYNGFLDELAVKEIDGRAYAGTTKKFDELITMEKIHQNTPYVKLFVFDYLLNINLFGGEPGDHTIEILSLEEENINSTYILNDVIGGVIPPDGIRDNEKNTYYDVKTINVDYNKSVMKRLITTGYSTLELTMTGRIKNGGTGNFDIIFYDGDARGEDKKIVKEETVSVGEIKKVTVDLTGVDYLDIEFKGDLSFSELILIDGVLKK